MDIGDIVRRLGAPFAVVDGSWPTDQGRQLILELGPGHVVVRHGGPAGARYHLFRREEVLPRLEAARHDIAQALDLGEREPTPLVAAEEQLDRPPPRCIVHEEGIIVGVFDAGAPLSGTRLPAAGSKRGPAEEEGKADLAVRELAASFPKEVELGVPASLLVSIAPPRGGVGSATLVLPPGAVVDLVIEPRRGFEMAGPAELTLHVGAAEDETLPVQFKLRGAELGRGEIRILAFRNAQALGVVTLRPVVVAAAPEAAGRTAKTQPLAPASARVPDMMLMIEERRVDGAPAFLMRLYTPDLKPGHNFTPFGPVRLRRDAERYFDELFESIEGMRLETAEHRAIASENLKSIGSALFGQLFPPDLQRILWDLRGNGFSLLVQSEEPHIPWELCRLCAEVDGTIEEGPFLCEAFTVARWELGNPTKEPLRLSNIGLVVPSDSGLALAPAEQAAMLALANEKLKVTAVPATFFDLQKGLASGTYDAWHFTGHGADRNPDPNKAEILLEREQRFTPDNLSGRVRNLGRARPLVFLNACQTGRGGMSLTDIGGWARAFLKAGAGAFIGTHWSVFDRPACDFARTFYARLLGGATLGQAAQEARAAIRETGDPTWLAYTLFAHPLATVQAA